MIKMKDILSEQRQPSETARKVLATLVTRRFGNDENEVQQRLQQKFNTKFSKEYILHFLDRVIEYFKPVYDERQQSGVGVPDLHQFVANSIMHSPGHDSMQHGDTYANNGVNEEIGLFDTITIYASELPRSKTHEEMMSYAWHEFCKRWSQQNGVKYQGATQLTTQCARHFKIPDRIRRSAAAAHYLRQIGALKLHLGSPRANNGVND